MALAIGTPREIGSPPPPRRAGRCRRLRARCTRRRRGRPPPRARRRGGRRSIPSTRRRPRSTGRPWSAGRRRRARCRRTRSSGPRSPRRTAASGPRCRGRAAGRPARRRSASRRPSSTAAGGAPLLRTKCRAVGVIGVVEQVRRRLGVRQPPVQQREAVLSLDAAARLPPAPHRSPRIAASPLARRAANYDTSDDARQTRPGRNGGRRAEEASRPATTGSNADQSVS